MHLTLGGYEFMSTDQEDTWWENVHSFMDDKVKEDHLPEKLKLFIFIVLPVGQFQS